LFAIILILIVEYLLLSIQLEKYQLNVSLSESIPVSGDEVVASIGEG